jgi:hypothetical protein
MRDVGVSLSGTLSLDMFAAYCKEKKESEERLGTGNLGNEEVIERRDAPIGTRLRDARSLISSIRGVGRPISNLQLVPAFSCSK